MKNVGWLVYLILALLLNACSAASPTGTPTSAKPPPPSTPDPTIVQATTIANLQATEAISPPLPAIPEVIPPTPTAFPTPALSPVGKLLDPSNLPTLTSPPTTATELYRFSTAGKGKEPFTAIAYTPVHNVLAISTEMEIWLWDLTTGQRIQTVNIKLPQLNDKDVVERGAASLTWSANGKLLAAGSFRGGVFMWRWDNPTNKLRAGALPFNSSYSQSVAFGSRVEVAFSPDSTKLAALGNDGVINVWDTELASLKADFTATFAATFAWSPDSAMLVDDYLTVHHLDTPRNLSYNPIKEAASIGGERPMGVAWSPDGKNIAVGGLDFSIGRVAAPPSHTENNTGSIDQTLTLTPLDPEEQKATSSAKIPNRQVAFSPDSQWVAVANSPENGKITLWDYASSNKMMVIDAGNSSINAYSWIYQNIIVTAGQDGTVRLWQLS